MYFVKAAEQGHIEIVKTFLNNNADIEAKNDNGYSPLILGMFLNPLWNFKMKKIFCLAAYKGNQEIVKELLNNNADIEAKDYDGNTPLFFGIFLFNCCI